jgi:hypothetical protein
MAISATSYAQDQKATSTVATIAKLSSINDGFGSVGLRHQFGDHLRAEVLGGFTVKSIDERESFGPMARSQLALSPVLLDDGLELSGRAFLDERRYNTTEEVLRNDGAQVALVSSFGDDGSNIAHGGFAFKRRDFFFPRDTSGELVRQERSEFSFELRDVFYYPIISNKLNAEISFDIAPRTVTRSVPGIDLSTLSSQFLTGTTFLAPSTSSMTASTIGANLHYLFPAGSLSTEIRYEERSESNALVLEEAGGLSQPLAKKISDALNATSYETRSTIATVRLNTELSDVNSLSSEFTARIYRFDTPSEENVDDRDEQYLYAILRNSHRFTPSLSFVNEARLAQGHHVYIESDRSAQNNITRTIALTSSVRVSTPRVRNTFSGEVFANYTEYDFLLPTSVATNDFVIRGISILDSFYLDLGTHTTTGSLWGLTFRSEYRLSERGSFNSDAFAERPLLETSELLAECLAQHGFHGLSSPLLVNLGVRGFFLNRRSVQSNQASFGLRDDERSSRIGPLAIIVLDKATMRGLRLYSSLWYAFVSTHRFSDGADTFGTQAEARLAAEWQF